MYNKMTYLPVIKTTYLPVIKTTYLTVMATIYVSVIKTSIFLEHSLMYKQLFVMQNGYPRGFP